jgi:hypothetical protein
MSQAQETHSAGEESREHDSFDLGKLVDGVLFERSSGELRTSELLGKSYREKKTKY